MIGHLDTVFEADDGFQSYRRDGDTAYGPGVDDMKSGNVVIVYALRALQAIGALDELSVTVAYTGDEEYAGSPLTISKHDLIEAGKWADISLGFEGGVSYEGQDWATISRRSSSNWHMEVSGKQAHSSRIFNDQTGHGAIFEAARILNQFDEQVRGEEYLTFNVGTIQGGTDVSYDYESNRGTTFGKTNVVPNKVIVHGDIRTISPAQLERTRDEDLGRGEMPILDPSRRGAADISFVAPYSDSLAGLGPVGDGGHTPNESLDLTSMPVAIKRAALLLYRLVQQ